jgi:small subunit ribosomal protein S1
VEGSKVFSQAEVGLMVLKPESHISGGGSPQNEEWWTALLADEEKFGTKNSQENDDNFEPKKDTRLSTVNWKRAEQIFQEDETIHLKVTGFNRGGLLVQGVDLQGFVPLSHLVEISTDKSEELCEKSLSDYVGENIHLKIIECDQERGRVVFSERAALAGPGRRTELLSSLNAGDCLHGKVTNITDFGVFVDLGGIEGLVHVSELSWGRVRHPKDVIELGDTIKVFVIKVDEERSRVALSLKRLQVNPWISVQERYTPGQITNAVITSILPFGAFARLEEGLDGLIHLTEMGIVDKSVKPQNILNEGQEVKVRVIHVDPIKQRLGLSLQVEPEE